MQSTVNYNSCIDAMSGSLNPYNCTMTVFQRITFIICVQYNMHYFRKLKRLFSLPVIQDQQSFPLKASWPSKQKYNSAVIEPPPLPPWPCRGKCRPASILAAFKYLWSCRVTAACSLKSLRGSLWIWFQGFRAHHIPFHYLWSAWRRMRLAEVRWGGRGRGRRVEIN